MKGNTSMNMREAIAELIEKALQQQFPQAAVPENLAAALEVPPEANMGDLAFPCFRLSKALRMAPPAIASALAKEIDTPGLARVEVAGGYLNFFFNREPFAKSTLETVLADPEGWSRGHSGDGKTVCMDYSSINIAKRFHIGHLSTTVLGNSLMRIYAHMGWKCVGINHLGDWGTQFGKMIAAYKHWGSPEMIEAGGVDALTQLYVRFHAEAEKDPALNDEGREWFKKIEDGDPEAMEIFSRFKEMTLKDAQKVYDVLGVHFDSYAGESFYNDKMQRVVDELSAGGLLKESDGAMIVDLEEYKMPPCLILKSDGATLYATRDIAAALYRKDTYHFDRCLYIVAYQQNLHFRQWFKALELMGYPWAATQLKHVAFGMVSYEGQTLSTRDGHVVYLEEVLRRAQEKALGIIEEKSPGLEDKATVARQVGVGAVVYSALQNSRIKDIDFWWDRALNFDGETGPYVQYTFARCCSVLRKAEGLPEAEADWAALTDNDAHSVLCLLSRFPEAVADACDKDEPFLVTRAVTELAKAYNKFYYDHRVLDENDGIRAARVSLTRAVRDTIRTGLYLIGLEAPERM